ncbi:MAG: CoA transferase [Pseudomonadota bacterium]
MHDDADLDDHNGATPSAAAPPDAAATADAVAAAGSRGPLGALRVLDLSQGIAGPSCGGLFAEYGADVIKIEPVGGDWVRALGTRIDGSSAQAITYNRAKRSLALDLKHASATPIVLKLAERADVVIQNARPGAMTRLGLDFDAVRARNPRIVYVSISGYGQQGPNAPLAMVDTVGQAQSGLMSVALGRDGMPTKLNVTLIDHVTGLYGFQAAMMALWTPKAEREAQHLDISLMQSAAMMMAPYILEWSAVGHAPGLFNAPAGNYATADGYFAVTLVTDAHFKAIAEAIGQPALASDERFATFPARKAHADAICAILRDAMATDTTASWVNRFAAASALGSQINTYGDWLADPHVQVVKAAPAYPLSDGGNVSLPHTPGAPAFNAAAPAVGEHSRAILSEAGLSDAAVEALVAEGAVVCAQDAREAAE